MKARMLVAILAAFLAVGLSSYRASAHDDGGFFWQATGGGACGDRFRISNSNATCMSSGWSWFGYAPYWATWAENHCASYGSIVAHVDVPNEGDTHIHADSAGRTTEGYTTSEPRNISCCIGLSDLCWKDQVEKITSGSNAGTVRVYRVVNGQRLQSNEDVSTHQARYDLCARWPDYIYCEVDPEGDAFTDPATLTLRDRPCGTTDTLACNCGDHFCDEQDCEWHWEQSSASQSCWNFTGSISMPANDGTNATCTIQSTCVGGGRAHIGTYTGHVANFRNLHNCSGTLQVGAC